jgi:carboxymethylenebutenolidase
MACCIAGASSAAPRSITTKTSLMTLAGLPTEQMAKELLSAALAHRHPQWIDIPAGSAIIHSFVVFPDGGDKAPVLVLTANDHSMSDWLRAVGDEAAQNGFIAVVPEHRAEMLAQYALNMPASNGSGAAVNFNFDGVRPQIEATVLSPQRHSTSFELTGHAWHNVLALLAGQTTPAAPAGQRGERGQRGGRGGARDDERANMQEKKPELPANFLMAGKTVAQSPRKGQWVDIPMESGVKLHTWISYPQGVTSAPVVLVFQPGPGMDMGEPPTKGGGANWLRAIADQLAYEGFIGVLPDLTSGLGPNGGNFDSFKFADDSAAALNKLSHAEVLNRVRAAREYALKLPIANGKLGVTGFCAGGGLAWESAAEIEKVNVAVVFYGGPPAEPIMAKIKAPVAAFFGTNDLGLAPRIEPATADMKRLGKEFDVHVYEGATHVFLYRQDLGRNWAATRDAWPKAMAFFKKYFGA